MSTHTDSTPLIPSARSYVKFGLGGAGNYISSNKLAPSSPIPCPPHTTSQSPSLFHTGVGGAGNRTSSQDRAFLGAEEDVERSQLKRDSAATSWHHGIGGAGNRASSDDRSFTSSSLESSGSVKPREKLGCADRIKEKIGEKWQARNQRVSLFQAWQRKLPTLERERVTEARSIDSYDGFAVKC
jgi:hypothetical protein